MTVWPGNARGQKTTFGGLSRSELMSRVRGSRNKTTEERLAALLRRTHLSGWRRNYKIFGHPDFAWPSEKLVVFVDGCFWHGHDCGRWQVPGTNAEAWRRKIAGNRARDQRTRRALRLRGWQVLCIWECRLNSRPTSCIERIRRALIGSRPLRGDNGRLPGIRLQSAPRRERPVP